MLNKKVILYMEPRFSTCSTPIKVKILMSLLYIKQELRDECKVILSQILNIGEEDQDDWVKKLSRLLQPYVATGKIDLKETDTETVFKILSRLDDRQAENHIRVQPKPPLESTHMCDALRDACLSGERPKYRFVACFQPGQDFEHFMAPVEQRAERKIRMATRKFEKKFGFVSK